MSDFKDFKLIYIPADSSTSRGGGQGTTKAVIDKRDETKHSLILKTLNKPNDEERRARMRREYVALETLDISGVPKAIDSNTEYFQDLDYKLFIVMELIPGMTLYEWLDKSKTVNHSAAELQQFFHKLITIIDGCHDAGIIHRDLKPDNIILRDDNLANPWLVDLGQSFNLVEELFETPDGQIMGNRFLFLPELAKLSGNKRDYRSDLTMAVGILFFILTNEEPGHLIDEGMKLPHQRNVAINESWQLTGQAKKELWRFFDVGFQPDINHRFQSAEAMSQAFEKAIAERPVSEELKDKIAHFNEGRKSKHAQTLLELDKLLKEIYQMCHLSVENAITKLGGTFNLIAGKYLHKITVGIGGGTFGIIDKFNPDRLLALKLAGTVIGNEIIFIGERISHTLDDTIILEQGEQIIRINRSSDGKVALERVEAYVVREVLNFMEGI